MTSRTALAACALALWAAPQSPPAADAAIARAGAYLVEYEAALGGLVAEEEYTQQLSYRTPSPQMVVPRQTRRLKSDFMLVKFSAEEAWIPFRDVVEVDGKPVRDRDARLERLFLTANAEARRNAGVITAEAARYNLGRFSRTINVPVLALEYLRPANAARCRFDAPRRERVDGEDAWKIDFKEQDSGPTVIRDSRNGGNVPASGTFWIRASDAAVLRTLVKLGNRLINSNIEVRYCASPSVPVLVPCRMSEKYYNRNEEITGVASYANIRQFKVTTTEAIKDQR